jgi:PAS domain S-box-containing protein
MKRLVRWLSDWRPVWMGSRPNAVMRRMLPLQMVGVLSALVFAFNFCLEIFSLLVMQTGHAALILGLQICLAVWAWTEAALLRQNDPTLPLHRLQVLLALQIVLEAARLTWLFIVAQDGTEGSFGVTALDLSPLGLLIPLYLLMFFSISRELLSVSRHELEQAYRTIVDMEESALQLTDSIPVGTYTVVLKRGEDTPRFQFLSKRFLEITGLDREQVLADPATAFDCVHPDDRTHWDRQNAQAMQRREPFFGKARFIVHGQPRWITAESVPRDLPDGNTLWEGVLTDVTDRVLTEQRLQATLAEQARQQERELLLQDMHDGFGSQLQSARLLVERGQLPMPALAKLIGECVEDLHLVVDVMGNRDQRLHDALVDYRHRMQYRTADLPCRLQWDIRLDTCPVLSERVILQLMRIVQEALSNAIRHAHAKLIDISAFMATPEQLVLAVADDGQGLSEPLRRGRGLGNMQKRATVIGASLSIGPREDTPPARGTQVQLTLDLTQTQVATTAAAAPAAESRS